MPDDEKPQEHAPPHKEGETDASRRRRVHWVWPLGLAVAGIGSAAAFMLRGCWHTKMSWPVRHDDDFSYQVCPACGIKRLFDQTTFQGYGPYGYDLHELIARERTERRRRLREYKEKTTQADKEKPEPEP